jgi:radical SAM superfamily enzyme YgiQ (UPF0313 family)
MRLPPFLGYKNHHPRDVTLPLTIGYIGTMARQQGWDVTVRDVWGREDTLNSVLDEIRTAAPDVIFFEAHAPPLPVILRVAEAVRSFTDALIVAFGSVPTFMPERIIGPDLPIHVGIYGESEITAAELLQAVRDGRPWADVDGIAYWDEGEQTLRRTPERPLLDDLDQLPIIDYELFDIRQYRKYSFPMPIHTQVRWGHVLATRGCPYPCTHCSFDHRQTFGRKFRTHSPKYLVDNLELLNKRYGINAVSIEDDIFSMDRAYVLAVCDEILRRGVKVKWIAQTRVDRIDRPLIRRMKEAGCVGVSLGIESGNDRVLKELKKGFTRAQAMEGIRICQDEGVMMRLLFMIGNPTETADEVRDTIDLACQAKAITVQVHISTPYPGTGLLGEAGGDGDHITDFSSYNKVVYNLSAMTDDELWSLQKEFYRRYFFSWRYFMVFLRQRVWYMTGSWRHDIPLIFRVLKYLLKTARKQEQRDVDSVLKRPPDTARAVVRQRTADAKGVALPVLDADAAADERAAAVVGAAHERND